MAGYYRSFCPNFSIVIRPLTDLLSTKVNLVWSLECQQEKRQRQLYELALYCQEDSDGIDYPVASRQI